MLYAFENLMPVVPESCWVADSAAVIGDVHIGADTSIWFHTVVRGDMAPIRIGARTNVQDQCMLHVTYEKWPCHVGDDVTVGHGAILHGCRVGNGVLIGMGAIVMDGAEVGAEALVAAGALVSPGTKIPPRTLAVGAPARPKRELTAEELEQVRFSGPHYLEFARRFKAGLRPLVPAQHS